MTLETRPHFLIASLTQNLPGFWKAVFVYVLYKSMQTKAKGTTFVPEEPKVIQMGPPNPQEMRNSEDREEGPTNGWRDQ